MTTEFRVPDASCGHCKATIEQAVSELDGVNGAELDLESKRLRVQHDDLVARDALAAAIEGAGYTAENAS